MSSKIATPPRTFERGRRRLRMLTLVTLAVFAAVALAWLVLTLVLGVSKGTLVALHLTLAVALAAPLAFGFVGYVRLLDSDTDAYGHRRDGFDIFMELVVPGLGLMLGSLLALFFLACAVVALLGGLTW